MKGRYDFTHVYDGLKDFQRSTVDYVFRRLYLDPEPARRFLVADEVGLGKTLVARGLIARTIEHLQGKVPRIDVVYVCSNADIARQNIERLNVTGQGDFALASRITLLPLTLRELTARPINFVSFTPGTSFAMGHQMGKALERVLLYEMLRAAWGAAVLRGNPALRVLQGNVRADRFKRQLANFRQHQHIEATLQERFIQRLEEEGRAAELAGQTGLQERFADMVDRLRWKRHLSRAEAHDRRRLVGDLRALLAKTCVEALEPDLIILDEFQRFRDLLDGDDEGSELARNLFEYSEAKVLLLSATPYKMYTRTEEADEDHYADFTRTLRFLMGRKEADRCANDLRDFRRQLLQLDGDDPAPAVARKRSIERRLRRVIARTERLASTIDRDGMLVERLMETPLEPGDLRSFRVYDAVFRRLDILGSVEYWKSAPYLLNLMEGYQLGRKLLALDPEEQADCLKLLDGGKGLLSVDDVRRFKEVDPGNARLRGLLADTVGRGAWRLLWLPPSLPYYQPGPPFDASDLDGITKRLVFSSWTMVPKAIATLVSYEAERRMVTAGGAAAYENTRDGRKRPQLLRFSRTPDRLSGLSLFGLVYPSGALARLADPLEFFIERSRTGAPPSRSDLLVWARGRVERALAPIIEGHARSGPVDEQWYWAAPLLLDRLLNPVTIGWLRRAQPRSWVADDTEGAEGDGSLLADVLEHAVEVVDHNRDLGRVPGDLVDVVARLSLAGPAVTARRAVARGIQPTIPAQEETLCEAGARIAWGLRNLFNLPEVTTMVRSLPMGRRRRSDKDDAAYWRRFLHYCLHGNLQSVLDEYAHVLPEWQGQLGVAPDDRIRHVAAATRQAVSMRTSPYRADEVRISAGRLQIQSGGLPLRGRFALRFGHDQSDEAGAVRADHMRLAFNSPFWPFILATTSIGQEGLDFHLYCHAIVHWNLPSNPVDLEQREGRVHRYKGHAVRKNLAATFRQSLSHASCDPWSELFQEAGRHRNKGQSEISPYWVFCPPGGAKIERYVAALPLSRERSRLDQLHAMLGAYRLVFGQPRQEDLLAYLAHLPLDQETLTKLQIDLRPPKATAASTPAPRRRGGPPRNG